MKTSHRLFLPACLLAVLVYFASPHAASAQDLAQQIVQAEEVAKQNDANPRNAKNYASTLGQAFGPSGNYDALLAAAQQLAQQRPADSAAIAAAAAVFVSPRQAARLAAALAATSPAYAASIASAVAGVHPSAASNITAAVGRVPGVDLTSFDKNGGASDAGGDGGWWGMGGAGAPMLSGFGFGGGGGGGGSTATTTASAAPAPTPAPAPQPDTR